MKDAAIAVPQSVPDEADLFDLLMVEIFHAFAEIDTAMVAIKAGCGLIFFQAPDDHTVTAERFQQPPGFTEKQFSEADTLIFRAQIKLVDLAFLRQCASAIEAEGRITRDSSCHIQNKQCRRTARRLAPPVFAAALDHLRQSTMRNDAGIGMLP